MAIDTTVDTVMKPPDDTVAKLEREAQEHSGPYEFPPEDVGSIGRTMFDMPSSKDGTVTVLMPANSIADLPGQSLVKIKSAPDKRTYIGAVVEGPFTEPDGLRADSTPMVVSATKGHMFLPPYHGRAQIEIVGELDEDNEMSAPRRRPSPNSPVFTMGVDEMSEHLGLAGNVRIGLAEGFDDMPVLTDTNRKDFIPRHIAVLGTTGGGKSTTVSGLVARTAAEGMAIIMIDTEGEYCEINEPTSDGRMKRALSHKGMEPKGVSNTHVLYPVGRTPKNDKHPSKAAFSLRFANLSPYTFKEILDLSDAQEERFFKAYDVTKVVMGVFKLITKKGGEKLLTHDELSDGYPDMKFSYLYDVVAQVAAIVNEDDDPHYLVNNIFKDRRDEFKKAINTALNASKKKSGGDAASWRALLGKLGRIKRLNVFDNPNADPLDHTKFLEPGRVSILDLSDTDSPVVNNLVIADILRCTSDAQNDKYTEVQKSKEEGKGDGRPTPVMVVIEEAHEFLSRERITKMGNLFQQVARIARRGRKRWMGLCFVTQLPQHLPDEVFGLVNSFVLHKISDSNVLKRLKSAVGNVPESMWERLHSLAPGQALVSLVTMKRPLFVNIDPTPCRLLMTD